MNGKPFFSRAALGRGTEGGKKSFAAQMFQHGSAAFITGLIGVLTGFATAYFSWESTEKKIYLELRAKQAEEVARHFARYTLDWGRMITQCRHRDAVAERFAAGSAKQKPSVRQVREFEREQAQREQRLLNLATSRNAARDALYGALGSINLYFGERVITRVGQFEVWDMKQLSLGCESLPDISAWEAHRREILSLIRAEIAPRDSR